MCFVCFIGNKKNCIFNVSVTFEGNCTTLTSNYTEFRQEPVEPVHSDKNYNQIAIHGDAMNSCF
jgi:hypothetical protein